MAVAPDNLKIIRIGAAPMGEFACWRYEPRLRRRRLRWRVRQGAAVGVVGVGGSLAVLSAYATASLVIGAWTALWLAATWPSRRPQIVAEIGTGDEAERILSPDLRDVRLARYEGQNALCIGRSPGVTRILGRDITLGLGLILPYVNRTDARPAHISTAVDIIHRAGGPEALLERAVTGTWTLSSFYGSGIEPPRRLALEMAAHEEMEAEALRGELKGLERAWQRAEGLASISDGLLMERETALIAKMKNDLVPVASVAGEQRSVPGHAGV